MVPEIPTGARLAGIRRAVFVSGADVDGATGSLELSFDHGQTLCFHVAGNGESISVEPGPWKTHFPEPLSPENQDFLWESGKWEIIDAGACLWSYRQFVGRRLSGITAIGDSGLVLEFGGMFIRIEAVADELHVSFARPVGEEP
jgi:hypothetical protein